MGQVFGTRARRDSSWAYPILGISYSTSTVATISCCFCKANILSSVALPSNLCLTPRGRNIFSILACRHISLKTKGNEKLKKLYFSFVPAQNQCCPFGCSYWRVFFEATVKEDLCKKTLHLYGLYI